MVFYNYTNKKMIRSISTWVTLVIAILPLWGFSIISLINGIKPDAIWFGMTAFFTIPLPAIFVTYKAGDIFRNEIENKTLITLQSKPISKSSLILQGMLSLLTIILIYCVIGILLPGLILIGSNKQIMLNALLVAVAELIILSIFALISLRLSLSLKGKSYVGIMIGLFGVGFYILFGISIVLKFTMSRSGEINSWTSENRHGMQEIKYTGQNGRTIDSAVALSNNPEVLYKEVNNLKSMKFYDYFEWINPPSHWMRMFGSLGSLDNDNKDQSSLGNDISSLFLSESTYIKDVQYKMDSTGMNKIGIVIKYGYKQSVPNWYVFLIWILIGGLSFVWTFYSLKKRNIT